MYIHEPAAAQNSARKNPVIGGDDDTIGAGLDNCLLNPGNTEVRKYRDLQSVGELNDFVGSRRRQPSVTDQTDELESCRQRFQGAQRGRSHPE